MSTSSSLSRDDAERIARRYPHPRASAGLLSVLGLVILALVAWVVWVAAHKADPPVSGRIDAFSVVSDTEATGTLTVDRPDPARPVRCLVFVQAVDYQRVGEKYVDLAPGTDRLTTLAVSLRTFKRGTTVSVDSCQVTG